MKLYVLEEMTQEKLNELALERNKLEEENRKLKNAIIKTNLFINEGRIALASKYIKDVIRGKNQ
jgi:hypothetical protein